MERETIEWKDCIEYQSNGWAIVGIEYVGETIETRILKPIMGKE